MKPSIAAISMILMSHAMAQLPPASTAPLRERLEWQEREIQRMQDEQMRENQAANRAAYQRAAEDRAAAADRAAEDRAVAADRAAEEEAAAAADMEWFSYPDEEIDKGTNLFLAELLANTKIPLETRIRMSNEHRLAIARLKKDKVMRERRLLDIERQRLEIERQKLENEILRAKLAADAKQAPAGK
jgi:hypothetical protein